MAKKKAWNAKNSDVYHNDSKCTEGNNIEKRNLQQGTGGKRKCHLQIWTNGLLVSNWLKLSYLSNRRPVFL